MTIKIEREDIYVNDKLVWNPNFHGILQTNIAWNLKYDDGDEEYLGALPLPLRTLYYLWFFECNAGSSGIEGILLDMHAYQIRAVYEALTKLEHTIFVEAFENAIALSQVPNSDGELICAYQNEGKDLHWFKHFKNTGGYSSMFEIDQDIGIYKLIYEDEQFELNILKYIEDNIDEVVS